MHLAQASQLELESQLNDTQNSSREWEFRASLDDMISTPIHKWKVMLNGCSRSDCAQADVQEPRWTADPAYHARTH